jgi:hypothetical protein
MSAYYSCLKSTNEARYTSKYLSTSAKNYENGTTNSFSKVLNNSNITQNTGYNEYGKYGSGYNSSYNMTSSYYQGKYR